MQRCLLHQLEGGRIDLAVLEIHRLIKLLLLPLCYLQQEGSTQLWTVKLICVYFPSVWVSPLMGSCNPLLQESPKGQNGVINNCPCIYTQKGLYTQSAPNLHYVHWIYKDSVPSVDHYPEKITP